MSERDLQLLREEFGVEPGESTAPAPRPNTHELQLLREEFGPPQADEPSLVDAAVRVGAKRDPRQTGRALELSQAAELPTDFVGRNLDRFAREERISHFPFDEIKRSPVLQQFFSNPDAAAVALDDAERIVDFWRAMNGRAPMRQVPVPELEVPPLGAVLEARFESGRRIAFELPDIAFPLILEDLGISTAPPEARARFEAFMAEPTGPLRRPGALDDILGAPLEQIPILGFIVGAGATGAAVGAVEGAVVGGLLGSVLPGPGTLAGASAGAVSGATIGSRAGAPIGVFKLEASAAYAEFQGLVDEETGQPLSKEEIAAGAVVVGSINASLELFGFVAVARAIPGLRNLLDLARVGRRSLTGAVRRQLVNRATRGAVVANARLALRAVGIEVATEIGQELTNIEVGRELTGEGVGLDAEELERLGEVAVQTALAVTPLVGIGTTVSTTMNRIATARQNAARIGAARQALADGSLREVSPTMFRRLTEEIAREAGIEDVGIPAERLLELYENDAGALLQDVPEAADQLADALQTGGDLVVPVGRYFGALDPRFGEELVQDLRLRPEDLTIREAEAAEGDLGATVEQVVTRELAERTAPTPRTPQRFAEQAARDALGLDALFPDARQAGMTPAEFGRYEHTVARAREEARSQLDRELQAERKSRQTEEWKQRRRVVRTEVESEVNARPAVRARHWLQRGEFLDRDTPIGLPKLKLDRDTLVEMFGREILAELPTGRFGVYQAEGGVHPDLVAELFDFQSGNELVQALRASRNRQKLIDEETDARMRERFGDVLTDGTLEERAVAAAQNEEQMRVLLIEERALAKRVGGQPTPLKVARDTAQRIVGAKRIRDLRPHRFRQAAEKAARLTVEALARGAFAEGARQKGRQVQNTALELEARRVLEDVERAIAFLKRFGRRSVRQVIGRAGADYLEQIDGLLERFDLRRAVPLEAAARRRAFADWLSQREAEGEEVVVPTKLRNEAFKAPWRELVVGDLLAVRDSAANVEHLARLKVGIIEGREQRELEAIEGEIVGAARAAFPTRKGHVRLTRNRLDNGLAAARSVDASLSKVEFIIDALTNKDPGSTLRRVVWEPLVDAQAKYREMLRDYSERIERLYVALGNENVRAYRRPLAEDRLTRADGTPFQVNKWTLIMVALNLGNASNRDKLLRGYGWTEVQVMQVLADHLTVDDWAFVQGAWDTIETLWPAIEAMERRLSGVAPPKVERQTLQTRAGPLSGGYFPVVYDPDKSMLAQRNEVLSLVPGLSEGYTRATTGHGHTKERTEVAAQIRLDQNVLSNHIDQVILDLTHREAIQRAGRVLGRRGVNEAFLNSLGPEFTYQRFWVPWLQSIARDTADPGPLEVWNRALRTARIHGTVFKLGFRETTLIAQVAGHFNGLRLLRTRVPRRAESFWLDGVFRAMGRGNPFEAWRTFNEVREASPFMRDRTITGNRELRDVVRDAQRTRKISDQVGAFSLSLIGKVQLLFVDMPLWLAAHKAAGETMGMTDERAVRFADSIVRQSQGGGTKLDLSAVQRGGRGGGEFLKATTMFYSYHNLVYNQLRESGRDVRRVRDVPSFLASYLMYAVFPGLYSYAMWAAINDRFPDPDEDDFDEQLRREATRILVGEPAATIPWVRDIWVVGLGERPRSSSAVDILLREAVDAFNTQDGMDLMFDVLRSGALIAGLPGDRPLRATEALIRGDE